MSPVFRSAQRAARSSAFQRLLSILILKLCPWFPHTKALVLGWNIQLLLKSKCNHFKKYSFTEVEVNTLGLCFLFWSPILAFPLKYCFPLLSLLAMNLTLNMSPTWQKNRMSKTSTRWAPSVSSIFESSRTLCSPTSSTRNFQWVRVTFKSSPVWSFVVLFKMCKNCFGRVRNSSLTRMAFLKGTMKEKAVAAG